MDGMEHKAQRREGTNTEAECDNRKEVGDVCETNRNENDQRETLKLHPACLVLACAVVVCVVVLLQ